MRLFNRHASKSTKNARTTATAGGRAARQLRPVRELFEVLENRQLCSVTVSPIAKLPVLPPLVLTNSAIAAEYVHTAAETDVYGANVQAILGSATSGVMYVSNIAGAQVQYFHNSGAIYWSAATGAHVVFGGIGAEYAALASQTDAYGSNAQTVLGLPTTDELALAGVAGARTNGFQYGAIDWSYSTGAHAVYGGINGRYGAVGGAAGWMGLPITDEAGTGGVRTQYFQDGFISWSAATNVAAAYDTSISIGTRYSGTELTITTRGVRGNLSVSEAGSTVTIVANGITYTAAAPSAGLFVYTRGGAETITINSSVTAPVTVDTIDGAYTTVWNFDNYAFLWADTGDAVLSNVGAHYVSSFAGGVSKNLGASLANPSDSGTVFTPTGSLWGYGPNFLDENQGKAADCYFLAPLDGLAFKEPTLLENMAVDLGDGTYAVQFFKNNAPVYVRVNGQFPVGGHTGGFLYAYPSSNHSLWCPVMEKAFAYFRKGTNTYASIDWGYTSESFTDLGLGSNSATPSSLGDAALYNRIQNDLLNRKSVTLSTFQTAPNLVGSHVYTVTGVYMLNGVREYIVRNPWGTKGDALEDNLGFATLTYAQLIANFGGLVDQA